MCARRQPWWLAVTRRRLRSFATSAARPLASVFTVCPARRIVAPATHCGEADATANVKCVLRPETTRPGFAVSLMRGVTHDVAEVTVSLLPSLNPNVAVVLQAPLAGQRGGVVISD